MEPAAFRISQIVEEFLTDELAVKFASDERVKTFGGVGEVRRAALRGTDGTNAQLYSEEIIEQVENLDEETRARIDELMDPIAQTTVWATNGPGQTAYFNRGAEI